MDKFSHKLVKKKKLGGYVNQEIGIQNIKHIPTLIYNKK